jgi:hypothetical protein
MDIDFDFELYLPAIMASLTVVFFGYFNFKMLQKTDGGIATGHPNYLYLAALALIVSCGTVVFQQSDFYRRM